MSREGRENRKMSHNLFCNVQNMKVDIQTCFKIDSNKQEIDACMK